MKTMYTLQELATELQRQQSVKVDYLAPRNGIHFVTGGGPHDFRTPGQSELDLRDIEGGQGLVVNDHAHGQIASRLKVPKRFYDRLRTEGPTRLLDEVVNQLLRYNVTGDEERRWMIRTLDGTARAVLSDSYRRVDNYDIAMKALPILNDIPDVKFRSCALTDTRMYIKAVSPRVTGRVKVGQDVCAGVYIGNSEVGSGKLVVYPFVETLQCTNGMVLTHAGEGMMSRVHLGRRVESDESGRVFSDATLAADDHALMLALADVVRAAVDDVRFRELVAQMARAAADEPITNVTAAVEVLAQREGLNEDESANVLHHLAEGGDLSRWGVVSAVTRTAEDVESYDRATELETLGGALLHGTDRAWRELVTA